MQFQQNIQNQINGNNTVNNDSDNETEVEATTEANNSKITETTENDENSYNGEYTTIMKGTYRYYQITWKTGHDMQVILILIDEYIWTLFI